MTLLATQAASGRRRMTRDVNGLFYVFGVLAVMLVSLPCPMTAADDAADTTGRTATVSEMKR